MGQKYKEKGGGSATGLADNFIGMLQGGLTGTFGGGSAAGQAANANPVGSTQGIAGILNDLLSGGAGNIGGSMADMIHQTSTRNVNDLRARYGASGGMSMGTPAAYAESMMRANEAPQLTQAIGGLQLQALMPLMQMISGLAGKGISQREGMMQQSPWSSIAQLGMTGLGAALGGPLGASIGNSVGSMFGGGGGGTSIAGMGSPTPFAGFDLPMLKF